MSATAPRFTSKTEEKEYYAGKLEAVELKIEASDKFIDDLLLQRRQKGDQDAYEREDLARAYKKRDELLEDKKRFGKILESLYVDPISKHNYASYKEAKGITDARTFLNAVAYDLYNQFKFSITYGQPGNNKNLPPSPTFGDVLRAWYGPQQENVDRIALDARFSQEQWEFMEDLNSKVVNPFLHKPSFDSDYKGRKVLVFPAGSCKKNIIQSIAIQSKTIVEGEDLIIRNSEETSTSSNKSKSP